MHEDD
jgi:hypothetical protein